MSVPLCAKTDDIRGKHSDIKIRRGINSLDDSIEKLIKNLQAATSRRANCHGQRRRLKNVQVGEDRTDTTVFWTS